jgi:hypothetical protein
MTFHCFNSSTFGEERYVERKRKKGYEERKKLKIYLPQ